MVLIAKVAPWPGKYGMAYSVSSTCRPGYGRRIQPRLKKVRRKRAPNHFSWANERIIMFLQGIEPSAGWPCGDIKITIGKVISIHPGARVTPLARLFFQRKHKSFGL